MKNVTKFRLCGFSVLIIVLASIIGYLFFHFNKEEKNEPAKDVPIKIEEAPIAQEVITTKEAQPKTTSGPIQQEPQYKIKIAAYTTAIQAKNLKDFADAYHYPAEVTEIEANGKTFYSVSLVQTYGEQDADTLIQKINPLFNTKAQKILIKK